MSKDSGLTQQAEPLVYEECKPRNSTPAVPAHRLEVFCCWVAALKASPPVPETHACVVAHHHPSAHRLTTDWNPTVVPQG
eukprot:1147537-Pelagomonas_calceolata.AAC.6